MIVRCFIAAAVLCFAIVGGALVGADWLQFRGPASSGVSDEKGLPTTWSATENIVWRTPLPGPGASSPIVVGDKVFVTCFTGAGEPQARKSRGKRPDRPPGGDKGKGNGPVSIDFDSVALQEKSAPDDKKDEKKPDEKKAEKLQIHLLCAQRSDGRIQWDRPIDIRTPEQPYGGFVALHGFSSGTPTSDGQAIYCFFGRTGVFAYDLDGKRLWQASVGDRTDGFGTANSPVLFGDLVIINASVESGKLISLNKKTGDKVWEAGSVRRSWNTPVLVAVDGRQELVVNTEGKLLAFDPATGKKLWECEAIQDYICPSVIGHDGVIYATGGRRGGALLAVRAGGSGDVSETHVVWRAPVKTNVPSPVYFDGHVYLADADNGSVHCINAKSGEIVFKESLKPSSGRIYASPLVADGKLFLVSREKGTFVLAAGPKFEQLAHNVIDDDTSVFNGSIAVHQGQFILRSDKNLYCIGKR